MDTRDWVGILLCILVWLPAVSGFFVWQQRKSKNLWRMLQVYCAAAVVLGLWLGLRWFPDYFRLLGEPRYWILAAVPLVGFLFLFHVFLPGRIRRPIAWGECMGKLLYYLIVIGMLEEVWFRGIWLASFKNSFVGGVVVGSVVFGLLHIVHYLKNTREIVLNVPLNILMGFCFGCARYNGAGVVLLGVAHGIFDFIFHFVQVDKKQRFGGWQTVTGVVAGLLLIAAATFLW